MNKTATVNPGNNEQTGNNPQNRVVTGNMVAAYMRTVVKRKQNVANLRTAVNGGNRTAGG